MGDVFHNKLSRNLSLKRVQEYRKLAQMRNKQRGSRAIKGHNNNNNGNGKVNNDGENIFDSKAIEDKPVINYTLAKRGFTKGSKL